ncbi:MULTISPECIES: hypothetical protein [Lysobacter]|jgi:hypothetical protein|uniref:hypothetical protein n=1 Tax=Lysobacter TaxID=68 RepID=UPI001F19FBE8|nr:MULTISPECIES: hypothetical protein [Lysobacter]UJB19962.1 hypothetical protein L1A79_02380 [Lysobacter capsici]UJQ30923.1 hypothetical protein L2D09_12480 [Lysobacter gummosus]
MNQDPYRAPSSTVPDSSRSKWSLCVAILAFVQVLLALLGAPSMLEMVSSGDVSMVLFGAYWLATASLLVGGAMLLWRKPLAAMVLCALSALGMSAALIDWRPLLSITGFGIALVGALVALSVIRRDPAAQV